MPTGIPIAILGYAYDRDDVQVFADASTMIGAHQIRRGRAPSFEWTRLKYRREDQDTLPGVERFNTAEETSAMNGGDCDDLACYLAASLRVEGWDAHAYAIESPGIGYHVIVGVTRRDNGEVLVIDPSARLGMAEP